MEYGTSQSIFLKGVYKDLAVLEDQSMSQLSALRSYKLVDTDPNVDSLFTKLTYHNQEQVEFIYTTAMKPIGKRRPGQNYPETNDLVGYRTRVSAGSQFSGKAKLEEEFAQRTNPAYSNFIDKSAKLLRALQNKIIEQYWAVFNNAFTAPSSQNRDDLFNQGNVDGLNVPLISTQHPRVDGGASQANTFTGANAQLAFSDSALWSAKTVMAQLLDDVGNPYPTMGGRFAIVVPPSGTAVRIAIEIAMGEWKHNSTTRDVNVFEGLIATVYTSPYLLSVHGGSDTAWFLVDLENRSSRYGTGLCVVELLPIQTKVKSPAETDNDVYEYSVKYESKAGWLEWRNVFGSKGDGSTYTG